MCLCVRLRLASKSIEEQAFATKERAVLVLDLNDVESLPRLLQELHVGPPPLLETEVNGRRRTQRQ